MSITWNCDVCHESVDDNDGYICCDWGAAFRALRAEGEQYERDRAAAHDGLVIRSLAEIIERMEQHPNPGWKVLHRNCDPHPDRDDYWFDVQRARTVAQMLDWNAHLAEKNWVMHTNWFRWLKNNLTDEVGAADA